MNNIILDSVDLGDNFVLSGDIQSPNLAYQQKRSLDGISALVSTVLVGGKSLLLGTSTENGKTQGIWCQQSIDAVKAIEVTNRFVPFYYYGKLYVVKVVDTTQFDEMFQWEPPGPTKHFLGQILMIEE